MKTELITNVSHDIKTPLTSIINYVDILSKEGDLSDKEAEYLGVLQRQSARLKKLIEDLIEASKASTGNLEVHMEPTDVEMLLEQALGEFEERLAKDKGTGKEQAITITSSTELSDEEIWCAGRLPCHGRWQTSVARVRQSDRKYHQVRPAKQPGIHRY